ncbi:hypothetical protein THRCLA_11133 [Thraustotheca clavata]|uniref:Domain of unknown function at the cortex 1 domain-containing protein n=1 Tax=Thraustotheca clavata TaxID=74557 RepID=A0A1V9Y8R6_9STRA|nr:hypothetical protein THRCLA_11133 [Thraustotheca clavata]
MTYIYRSYAFITQREPLPVDPSIFDEIEREIPRKEESSSSSSEPDDENTIRSSRRTSSTFENDPLHMLHVKNECGAQEDRITMNSIEPVPFENDLFRGHVYFLVKTDPPHWKWHFLFNGRRRMFWIQVQGQFKKQPKGVIYLGGELPDRIALGFFTRSLASVIMSIIQTLVKAVHYAFGDANELPHCAFPLYQSVDEMVITPSNEQPPVLGQESFGESKQEHQKRMKTPLGTETYDLSATYTFHFHTMYVDLTQWKIINLPGMKDVPLTTFFEAHPLRLVCYDVVPGKHHAKALKEYVFCFSVTYTEPVGEFSIVEPPTIDGSDEEVIAENDGRLIASATAVRPVRVPYWIEMLDFGLKKRSVIYMFACEDTSSNSVTFKSVHSKTLRKLVPFPLHIRSRLVRYKAIEAQRFQLQDILPLSSLILMDFNWIPYSATRLGVRINNTHRQSMIFQQESLRAVSDTFLRQEFLVLTKPRCYH